MYRITSALKRTVPQPESGSVFYFIGMPGRNGFQTGDGPAVRLLYGDPTLTAHYVSDIEEHTDLSRTMYVFAWDPRASALKFVPTSEALFNTMRGGLEAQRKAGAALALCDAQRMRYPTSTWLDWNRGYFLWELGDTAAARAAWARELAGANPPAGGLEREVQDALALPDPEDRAEALVASARFHPENPELLRAAARAHAARQGMFAAVLYYRACQFSRDPALLREARADLAGRQFYEATGWIDSLLATQPGR
jgi:hypothetical protein